MGFITSEQANNCTRGLGLGRLSSLEFHLLSLGLDSLRGLLQVGMRGVYWEWPEPLRRLVISVEHSSKPEDGCKTLEERKGEKVLEGMDHPSFSKVKPLQRNSQHKSSWGVEGGLWGHSYHSGPC